MHVSAAKAAVDATSAALAVEEGPHGVRSNVIAPGPIGGTEGMSRLSGRSATDGTVEDFTRMIPVGRAGDVRDIANCAVFLFSDAAAFVSGQIFVVDGANEHIRALPLPYPESVLDPASMKSRMAAKL